MSCVQLSINKQQNISNNKNITKTFIYLNLAFGATGATVTN